MNSRYYSCSKNEKDVRKDLVQEAFDMHRYYEEKYYTLIMISYDNDERHNRLLDEIQKKIRILEKYIRETCVRK